MLLNSRGKRLTVIIVHRQQTTDTHNGQFSVSFYLLRAVQKPSSPTWLNFISN